MFTLYSGKFRLNPLRHVICLPYTVAKFRLNPLNSCTLNLSLQVSLYYPIYDGLHLDTSSALLSFCKIFFSQNECFHSKLVLCSRNVFDRICYRRTFFYIILFCYSLCSLSHIMSSIKSWIFIPYQLQRQIKHPSRI